MFALGATELLIIMVLVGLSVLVVLVVVLVSRAGSRPRTAGGATSAGWYRDPTGRFELRYFDGAMWTESVSTTAVQSTDPVSPSSPTS